MDRFVGEAAAEQRRALARGTAGLAGVAVEQADRVALALTVADGESSGVASPVEQAVGSRAAEAREVVDTEKASQPGGWVDVQKSV
jgi:hypothetical protein